jgi:hypothetical protein
VKKNSRLFIVFDSYYLVNNKLDNALAQNNPGQGQEKDF